MLTSSTFDSGAFMFAPGKLTSDELLEGQNGEKCTTVPLHFLDEYLGGYSFWYSVKLDLDQTQFADNLGLFIFLLTLCSVVAETCM